MTPRKRLKPAVIGRVLYIVAIQAWHRANCSYSEEFKKFPLLPMGFQRSVQGCVGRKKLEAKPVTFSRSVMVMGVFPCAQEWWFGVSFFLFPHIFCFL